MDVSIVTVTYNDKERVLDQLQSIPNAATGITYEQFISDNGSVDTTVADIHTQFPDVHVIENKTNLGFGAANNKALKHAKGKYVLLLNPDMRLQPNSLAKLVAYMDDNPDIGVISPKLVDQHGNIQMNALPRRFPGVIDQFAIVTKLAKVFPSLLNRYLHKGFDSEKIQDVDSVRGSFMFMRKEIADQLGWFFDPRYFIWFEDVDTCKEIQRLGYRIVYYPDVECIDFVGQTFKRQAMLKKQVWFTSSMVKYFKKWHAPWVWIWIWLARPIGIAFAWIHDTILLNCKKLWQK